MCKDAKSYCYISSFKCFVIGYISKNLNENLVTYYFRANLRGHRVLTAL